MTDVSVLARLADLASQKVRYFGGVTFELTKSSFDYCRDKVERDKMMEYAYRMAVCCQNVMGNVHSSTRLYLRPDHMDMMLQRVCEQILQQGSTDLKMKNVVLDNWKFNNSSPCSDPCGISNRSLFNRRACFKDLLAAIIWHEFNQNSDVDLDYLPIYDSKMKSWNKRVNEKELLQKLGSPSSWDIFYDEQEEDESADVKSEVNELKDKGTETPNMKTKDSDAAVMEACIDQLQKVEDLKKRIMGAGDTYLTNDLRQPVFSTGCSKQKKRNGVLNSIKKMFKTEKAISTTTRSNNAQQETGENDEFNHNIFAPKNMKNSNAVRMESDLQKSKGKEKVEPACSADKQTNALGQEIEDVDKNSLMIHIPNNVQKIVLVKDGHKIKIEI